MNFSKRIAITVLGLAGGLTASVAQARPNVDVSVHIGSPGFVFGLPLPPVPHVVVTPSRSYVPAPVYGHGGYHAPAHNHGRGYGDRDRDGIPNRYDRVYNPRWDRDGDGIPNRYDRHPYHAQGHHGRGHDGVPNWRDNRDQRGDRDGWQRDGGQRDGWQRDGRRGGRD